MEIFGKRNIRWKCRRLKYKEKSINKVGHKKIFLQPNKASGVTFGDFYLILDQFTTQIMRQGVKLSGKIF